jgi:hypothetical protein|nr:MAG TPA: hypothetical protein [Caudoviricetes sp.]
MELREFLAEVRKEAITEIIDDVRFIAKGCYEEAIRRKQYADKSGRLSASIGWAVCYDGKVVHSGGFTGNGRKASAGQSAGREAVQELARESKGIRLILVAGAPYATQVEARGFDVTTSGELLAEEMVQWWLNNA